MKLRSSVFGWKSVWMDLAEEMNGEFTDSTYLTSAKLPLATKPWTVHMKMHAHPIGKSIAETTVIALPYAPLHELKLTVHNTSPIEEVAKIFGLHDITVGDPVFDKAFTVKGNNSVLLRELFADASLRELMLNQKSVNISIIDHQHKLFGIDPKPGLNVLAFAEKGAINSFDRLTSIFELLTAKIERLVHLEVAARESVAYGD
jgi:hypothetical protein